MGYRSLRRPPLPPDFRSQGKPQRRIEPPRSAPGELSAYRFEDKAFPGFHSTPGHASTKPSNKSEWSSPPPVATAQTASLTMLSNLWEDEDEDEDEEGLVPRNTLSSLGLQAFPPPWDVGTAAAGADIPGTTQQKEHDGEQASGCEGGPPTLGSTPLANESAQTPKNPLAEHSWESLTHKELTGQPTHSRPPTTGLWEDDSSDEGEAGGGAEVKPIEKGQRIHTSFENFPVLGRPAEGESGISSVANEDLPTECGVKQPPRSCPAFASIRTISGSSGSTRMSL